MADTTYYTAVDLAASPYAQAGKARIDKPLDSAVTEDNRIEDLPELVVGDSFNLVLYAFANYQDGQATQDWGSGATAALYIRRADSQETPVTLDAAGTVAQVGGSGDYYKITWTVEANEITSYFGDQDCLLYAVITSGTEKQHVFWNTKVLAVEGDGGATLTSSEIAVATVVARGLTSAPGVGDDINDGHEVGDYIWDDTGEQLYRCDDSTAGAAVWTAVSAIDDWIGLLTLQIDTFGADVDVALPASAGEPLLLASCINDTNAAKLTGTINDTTDLVLTNGGKKAALLQYLATDSAWQNFNLDVVLD